MRVERHVHVKLGIGLRGVARVRRVVLDQVPDAPADLPPADVAHHLLDPDARGPGVNVVGANELNARARVGRARHAHRGLGGRVGHHFGLEPAAIKDVVRDAGPLVIARPAFGRGPNFVSTVVGPARFHVVLFRRQDLARQVGIDEEIFLLAELQLNRAAPDVGRHQQADDAVREAINVPAFVLSPFELRPVGRCGHGHGPPRGDRQERQ